VEADMSEIQQKLLSIHGIQLNVLEAGEGPLVLLLHGFPELAHSWRHQLPALAAAGYRAVAPDLRGYGRSSAPEAIEAYTLFHLVGDVVGLVDHYREEQAVVVGHDWGSIVAWGAATLRPQRFRGVCGMSVPYVPRMPVKPTDLLKAMAGDRFVYILYFQEPGKAEAELEADVRSTLRRIYYTASGSLPEDHEFQADLPKTAGFLDAMVDPEKLPDWLPETDLDVYVEAFSRTGFRGGLNYYRNLDRNWELMAAWLGAKVEIPALFVGGAKDLVVTGPPGGPGNPLLAAMPAFVPDLRGQVRVAGAGHWNQQEKPEDTNRALLEFLAGLEDERLSG
jgi:pimeloyl-ACP methyl ester carboxylesterase